MNKIRFDIFGYEVMDPKTFDEKREEIQQLYVDVEDMHHHPNDDLEEDDFEEAETSQLFEKYKNNI